MYLRYYVDDKGQRVYTLQRTGTEGQKTFCAHPARFSPEDKYSKYRIQIKQRFGLLPTQQPKMLFGVRRQLRQFWRNRLAGKKITTHGMARYAHMLNVGYYVFAWNALLATLVYVVYVYRDADTGGYRLRDARIVTQGLRPQLRAPDERPSDEQFGTMLDEEA